MPTSIHGTNGITFNDGSTQTTRPAVGFRNRIINGDMRIDQRNGGASQSITAASPSYSVDRFIVRPIGATVTGQRVAGTGSTQYVYQLTGVASVTQLQFEQRIEASNSYDLAGGNATLSVNLSNSLLTTASWILYYATATDNFASNTLISSGSWTVSSSIARYNATISIPAAATTGLYLIIYVGAQTSGTFKIGDVQLEAGSTATEFERIPIGTELASCQRYFQKTYDVETAQATATNLGMVYVGSTATGVYGLGGVQYASNMRSIPSIRYWDGSGNENKCSYIVNNSGSTSFVENTNLASAPYNISTRGFLVGANVGANSASYIHYTANSEL
jgi:hypothetical protein